MALSGISWSMEKNFFTKRQSWKTVRRNRNQVAAHAQKRVTVPLSNSPYSNWFKSTSCYLNIKLDQSFSNYWIWQVKWEEISSLFYKICQLRIRNWRHQVQFDRRKQLNNHMKEKTCHRWVFLTGFGKYHLPTACFTW